jgi:hypothetical protein
MSLTGPLGSHPKPEHAQCFYCDQPLRAPSVDWMGATGTISLHPGCVVELTIRLYRDLHELECRTNVYIAKGL